MRLFLYPPFFLFRFNLISVEFFEDVNKLDDYFFQENFFVELTINGEKREIKKSQNLSDLVKELDIKAPNFAMALNQQVVPRSKYYSTTIKENDQIEIVHAVGGGI